MCVHRLGRDRHRRGWCLIEYDESLVDEFGRTLEEQLQDQVRWEWYLDEKEHKIDETYRSERRYGDGEDLPYGMFVTYDTGGPQFGTFEYFPHWHFEDTIERLEDSYEALLEEPASDGGDVVADGGSQPNPTAYAWFESGGQDKQPVIDDLGMGKLYYFFKTEDDANQFMQEYMKEYGVTDLSRYERVEVEITDVVDGEDALGFTSATQDEEPEPHDETEQVDMTDYAAWDR